MLKTLFDSFLHPFSLTGHDQATSDKDNLDRLNRAEFEDLLGDHYRQLGYQVKHEFSRQPDDGVDFELTKFGQISLVQCKHWKNRKVGVKVIREMYGVLLDRKADRMIIVTSGEFTLDAYRFSQGKNLKLINRTQLIAMLAQTKHQPVESITAAPVVSED